MVKIDGNRNEKKSCLIRSFTLPSGDDDLRVAELGQDTASHRSNAVAVILPLIQMSSMLMSCIFAYYTSDTDVNR